MVIDAAHYVLGQRQQAEPLTLREAAARPRSGSSFVWLAFDEPGREAIDELHDLFGLHELALEDAEGAHQRPKLEQYDDFHYIVFRTARYDEERLEVGFGEVHLFVGPGYVIEVRHGGHEGHARQRLERRPQLLKSGPAAVVWGILDEVVDAYLPVVHGIDADIEELERSVFAGADDQTERIYTLKEQVSDFYRAVHPLLAPLEALERGASFAEIDPGLKRYFRDVNDHLKLINDEVVAQREQLKSVLEANVALISVHQNRIAAGQNDTMKKLTALATVFLPITFVTGFFGQNFGYMVEHLGGPGIFVVSTIVQLAVVGWLLVFFRHRRWM
jgi:magnesium transporter